MARGATEGDVLVSRDLTEVGAVLGWGLPLAHPPSQGPEHLPGVPWAEGRQLSIPPGELRVQGEGPEAGAVRGCPTGRPLPFTEQLSTGARALSNY